MALNRQIFMHTRHTNNAATILMDLSDTGQQSPVINLSGTRCACFPAVITTRGNLQTTTHHAYRKLAATTLDRLIFQDDSLAKNVAASRKKSRSFFTRASSRFRRATSSSRGLPVPPNA